jgi:hypothetical protein
VAAARVVEGAGVKLKWTAATTAATLEATEGV